MSDHVCPVCGYPSLQEPPRSTTGGGSYEICPSCEFEFGVSDDDLGYTYDEWRREWLSDGMPWRSSRPKPRQWNPEEQLTRIAES